tara:strand:+ start:71423 stop:72328 length:906 start_codon:yes stop_codon:yes gene_type:complete
MAINDKYKGKPPVEDYLKDPGYGKTTTDRIKAYIGQPIVSNRFFVSFHALPKGFGQAIQQSGLQGCGPYADALNIMCQAVTLPGKALDIAEHSTFGPDRSMPEGRVDFGDTVALTFYCDPFFLDRFIIEEWLKMVHSSNIETNSELKGMNTIFRFYDEYAKNCEFSVFVLRKDGTVAMKYTFHEAYPTSYDPMSLDTEQTDTLLKFSVNMNYRYFSVEYPETTDRIELTQPKESNFSISRLNKGRRVFDAILDSLKVASRFNSKAGDILNSLSKVDSYITRAGTIGRDINPEFITNRRRGR